MLRLRATDPTGAVLREQVVGHGKDPVELLRSQGLEPTFRGAARDGAGALVMDFGVVRREAPQPYQRIAAYAVIPATVGGLRCVLLTSFAGTRRDGWWGLPGGGLDPGEDPLDGVRREVHEETGQEVTALAPVTVVSAHWTGPSPAGRLEDFHAVRLVYRGVCEQPGAPVVHDVGGTTGEAAWVPLVELDRMPVLEWARPIIDGLTATT